MGAVTQPDGFGEGFRRFDEARVRVDGRDQRLERDDVGGDRSKHDLSSV